MRTLRHVLLAGLVLSLAAACGGGDGPELETRTFQVRHLDLHSAYGLVDPYVYADRPGAPGVIGFGEEARLLTIRETPDNLDRIARVLEERDRPAPGVRLHFQVIEATPEEGPADPAIAEVEAALREVFRFGGYRLVAETVVNAVEGGHIRQQVAGPAVHAIHGDVLSVDPGSDGPAGARLTVRLWTNPMIQALETTVNVTDGRTLVVGTAGGSGGENALVLTVRPTFDD
jgi:hypothetical protein